jgi:hypothetical protein
LGAWAARDIHSGEWEADCFGRNQAIRRGVGNPIIIVGPEGKEVNPGRNDDGRAKSPQEINLERFFFFVKPQLVFDSGWEQQQKSSHRLRLLLKMIGWLVYSFAQLVFGWAVFIA